ncbi:MAG: hypothetical protein II942_04535 [Alphaproteobacteria bacterium]|nr:hypothetical protein [Alphaproteobacteria bacterium]
MTNKLKEQPTISQIIGAIRDFGKNYYDMHIDKTIGGDKYFHCKANFEASRRGPIGQSLATILSNIRELSNAQSNPIRKNMTIEDSLIDCMQDQFANVTGRQNAKNVLYKNAKEGCQQFRVGGINERY